ncbi:MAG: hypothetical protein OEV23_07375 [Gallionella sp.]|nr:hypothetical protein [Gallionella sp.]
MNQEKITAVANVLSQWNPLGDSARNVKDLDGYRVEATDIIFGLKMRGYSVKPERLLMEVLNQAFGLNLAAESCIVPAQKISAILGKVQAVQSTTPQPAVRAGPPAIWSSLALRHRLFGAMRFAY